MGKNSHNSTIDETQKPWAIPVSYEKYGVAIGTHCDICYKPYKTGKRRKPGDCKCTTTS